MPGCGTNGRAGWLRFSPSRTLLLPVRSLGIPRPQRTPGDGRCGGLRILHRATGRTFMSQAAFDCNDAACAAGRRGRRKPGRFPAARRLLPPNSNSRRRRPRRRWSPHNPKQPCGPTMPPSPARRSMHAAGQPATDRGGEPPGRGDHGAFPWAPPAQCHGRRAASDAAADRPRRDLHLRVRCAGCRNLLVSPARQRRRSGRPRALRTLHRGGARADRGRPRCRLDAVGLAPAARRARSGTTSATCTTRPTTAASAIR